MSVAPVLFLGSKRQGLDTLRALVATGLPVAAVTLDDREDGRTCLAEFTAVADAAGIPLTVVRTRTEAARAIAAGRWSLGVVVGWYWLLGAAERGAPAHGMIGVHNSLLPRYRGGAPLPWAMIDGATEVGASLMTLGEGVDDGALWGQVRVAVGPDDGIGDVLARLEPAAVALVAETVPAILAGTRTAVAQDAAHATWCAQRIPDDGVIDWRWPAARIHDFVRAQSAPYPGAFTYVDGARLVVWRTRPLATRWRATPGQGIAREGDALLVACGDDTVLALLEVGDGTGRWPAATRLPTRNVRFPAVPLLLDRLPAGTADALVAAA
jgi:methionyl-tRNA formyltransferase